MICIVKMMRSCSARSTIGLWSGKNVVIATTGTHITIVAMIHVVALTLNETQSALSAKVKVGGGGACGVRRHRFESRPLIQYNDISSILFHY